MRSATGPRTSLVETKQRSFVRKLTVALLRKQPQSLYGWHALCHSGEEQVHPLLKRLYHRTRR